jgi:hypothetical protein
VSWISGIADLRLVYVAQKYNPVRLFTPEGTVGIGGPLGVSEYPVTFRADDSLSYGRPGWLSALGSLTRRVGCELNHLT